MYGGPSFWRSMAVLGGLRGQFDLVECSPALAGSGFQFAQAVPAHVG